LMSRCLHVFMSKFHFSMCPWNLSKSRCTVVHTCIHSILQVPVL
jgi:hypothetical protein